VAELADAPDLGFVRATSATNQICAYPR